PRHAADGESPAAVRPDGSRAGGRDCHLQLGILRHQGAGAGRPAGGAVLVAVGSAAVPARPGGAAAIAARRAARVDRPAMSVSAPGFSAETRITATDPHTARAPP